MSSFDPLEEEPEVTPISELATKEVLTDAEEAELRRRLGYSETETRTRAERRAAADRMIASQPDWTERVKEHPGWAAFVKMETGGRRAHLEDVSHLRDLPQRIVFGPDPKQGKK